MKNIIEKLRNKIELEYEKKKQKIGELNVASCGSLTEGKIEKLFVIKTIINFLDYEIESLKCGIVTKLSIKDYTTIYNEINEVSNAFLGIYYNTDLGTSYSDIQTILETMVEDIESIIEEEIEQGQPYFRFFGNLKNGKILQMYKGKYVVELYLEENVGNLSFWLKAFPRAKNIQGNENKKNLLVLKCLGELDIDIFDRENIEQFMETEFEDLKEELKKG